MFFELAKQGTLAVLLGLAIYFYHKKDLALVESYRERIGDNAKVATVIEATNTAYRALEQTSDNRSRVLDHLGEATRASTEAVKQLSATLDSVRQNGERNAQVVLLIHNNLEAARRDRQTDFDAFKREVGELLSDLRNAKRS